MCANAAADGVVGIVATPHVSRCYPTDYTTAKARLPELAGSLDSDVRLELFLGAEVTAGLVASLSQERLCEWSIGGRFLLIEVENGWARRTIDLNGKHRARRRPDPGLGPPRALAGPRS